MTTAMAGRPRSLVTYRDDGIISQSFGRLAHGKLPPLLPAVAGVTVTIALSVVGVASMTGLMVAVPVVAMAIAGLGSRHPHDGRLDWLVPPVLALGEYVFLVAVALAGRVPGPLIFAVVGVIALHHCDIAGRLRPGGAAPRRWLGPAGLGWEGRMLVAALGAMAGLTPLVYAVLAGYLWVLFGWESVTGWLSFAGRDHGARRGGLGPGRQAADRAGGAESGGG